jgi:hypothetical protein
LLPSVTLETSHLQFSQLYLQSLYQALSIQVCQSRQHIVRPNLLCPLPDTCKGSATLWTGYLIERSQNDDVARLRAWRQERRLKVGQNQALTAVAMIGYSHSFHLADLEQQIA